MRELGTVSACSNGVVLEGQQLTTAIISWLRNCHEPANPGLYVAFCG